MTGMLSDLRYAVRTLVHNPGFTVFAVLILALGIGANTAIFSVVQGVLLRPLPFPEPDRLVELCEVHPSVSFCVVSTPNAADLARESRTLSHLGVGREWPFMMREGDRTRGITGGLATPSFFDALGIQPAHGRLFAADEVAPGDTHVAMLTHGFWASEFGADPGAVGRSLILDGESYAIIGVLPPDARIPHLERARLWLPLPFAPGDEENRSWRGFQAVARLAPGAGLDDALGELTAIQRELARSHPAENDGWGLRLVPLHESLVGDVRPRLAIFMGAVGVVLLIGCANLGNLMLVRATRRQGEYAVRTALGAGRHRLLRLAFAESLVVSLLGAGAGVVLAIWGTDIFVRLAPRGIPRVDQIGLDAVGLGFALALALLTTVLFGLVPALRAGGLQVGTALKDGERRTTTRSGVGLRHALVASEVALALVLVIAAGLLTRSFASLLDWRPGFDAEHVTTAWLLASPGTYERKDEVRALFDRVSEEAAAVAGVESVGLASAGPLFGGLETDEFEVLGRAALGDGEVLTARWFDVDEGYFQTLGLPVRRGRGLLTSDAEGAPRVALINETMARRFWPGDDPVGARIRWVATGEVFEIVGVVADVPPFETGAPILPEIYWPFRQITRWASFLVMRTGGDPASVGAAVRDRLETLGADLDIGSFTPMESLAARRLVGPRFNMLLLGVFAGLALLLAGVGIYAVISFSVAARTHEIGVRVALGAGRSAILRSVLRTGLRPAVVGVAIGLVVAVVVGRTMAGLLFGVKPGDPVTFVGTALVLGAVALLACWVPARRATRLDPMAALRHE